MARMEGLTFEMANLIESKEAQRKALAALPFPEKVRAVVALQKMVVPIVKKRNPRACVWRIDERE